MRNPAQRGDGLWSYSESHDIVSQVDGPGNQAMQGGQRLTHFRKIIMRIVVADLHAGKVVTEQAGPHIPAEPEVGQTSLDAAPDIAKRKKSFGLAGLDHCLGNLSGVAIQRGG